jgi:hypothetical protein
MKTEAESDSIMLLNKLLAWTGTMPDGPELLKVICIKNKESENIHQDRS